MRSIVEEKIGDYVVPEVSKTMKKAATELAAKIQSLQNTNSTIAKLTNQIEALEGQGTSIPEGQDMRKVPIGFETPLLDTESMGAHTSINIDLPEELTLREAKELIHKKYLEAQKRIDLKVLNAQRDMLRQVTKKSTFTQKILDK